MRATTRLRGNIFIILSVLLLATACVNQVDDFIPSGVVVKEGDVTELMKLMEDQPREITINANSYSMVFLDRAILTFTPQIFETQSGQPVQEGELVVKVREIYDKSAMIRHNVPTVTNGHLLESDGVFHIEVYRNGERVQLAPGKTINIKIENSNPRAQMELFYGKRTSDTDFYWEEADGDMEDWSNVWQSQWTVEDSGRIETGFGYEMDVDQLDWINCDIFNNENPTTTVCVDLPDGYDAVNSRGFIVFHDINALAPLNPDPDREMFCTNYAPVPLEREISLFVMSKVGEKYFADKKSGIVVPDMEVQLVPAEMSLEEIEDIIDNL